MNSNFINKVVNDDCFEVMSKIEEKSVDMILCDLPYGTSACYWDSVLPFDMLWKSYDRVIKDDGVIVLTASQPFTSALIMSNIKSFKYTWIWVKTRVTNVLNAKIQPLRSYEDVAVFCNGKMKYNPQGVSNCIRSTSTGVSKKGKQGLATGKINQTDTGTYVQTQTGYPKNVLNIKSEGKTIHPTQKPVALFEYLIKTYTDKGDLVLDNCAGSCTTAIAAINCERNWICIEKDNKYFQDGLTRVENHIKKNALYKDSNINDLNLVQ